MKKKEEAVKRVKDLSKEELEQIVESIQGWLWVGDAPAEAPKNLKNCEVWDPNKSMDSGADFIANVSDVLENYGLRPTKIVKFDG